MTVLENPHAHLFPEALKKVRAFTQDIQNETTEWISTGDKQGIATFKQQVDVKTMDMIRGDVFFKTKMSCVDFSRIISCCGIRSAWDPTVDKVEARYFYHGQQEILGWAKYKTPWPVTARDFCLAGRVYDEENETYVVMLSVQDDRIPPMKGCVRADLKILGWRIQQKNDGLNIRYVNHVDLCGSVPVSLLKLIQGQLTLCVGQIIQYAMKNGFPPYLINRKQDPTIQFMSDSFDPKKRIFTTKYQVEDSNAELMFSVSRQMYPKGITVKAPTSGSKNNNKSFSFELKEHDQSTWHLFVKNTSQITISPK